MFHLGIGLRLQSLKQRQYLPNLDPRCMRWITLKRIDILQLVTGQTKNERIGPQIYEEVNREE